MVTMSTLRLVSIVLALAALCVALLAAWKWYQVSRSVQDPRQQRDLQLDSLGRGAADIRSITISAPFYKEAAVWTGLCVVLGALSSVAGAFSLSLTLTPAPIVLPSETARAPISYPVAVPRFGGAAPAAWRQICQPDFQKLCPDARPGPGGAIAMCIKQNRASLSDPCKSAIAEARTAWQAQSGPRAAMRQACMADFQRFCPDAKPGAGGIARCIQQNRQSLSESCSTAVAQMRAARQQRNAGAGAGAAPGADLDPAQ